MNLVLFCKATPRHHRPGEAISRLPIVIYAVIFLTAEWLTVLFFLLLKIPTTDVDLSVLASTPLPKSPDKTSAELEETKVALKELQRHFETYKTERTQAEE